MQGGQFFGRFDLFVLGFLVRLVVDGTVDEDRNRMHSVTKEGHQ